MGVVVLHPRDCLNNRQKKPVTNRRRRSPPRQQSLTSPPKNLNHNNQVRILKRGEEIVKPDLVIEKPDLKSTRQIRSEPVKISNPIGISNRKSMPALFYAGPVTSTSPPPSEVPLPAFFAKKSVSVFKPTDATNDLIRILRLDIE